MFHSHSFMEFPKIARIFSQCHALFTRLGSARDDETWRFPLQDKVSKCRLMENIGKRGKLLNRLRLSDYDKFERLCDELKIVFAILPEVTEPKTIRYRATKAAGEESVAIRLAKMKALEKSFDEQRAAFYQEKQAAMADIERDLRAMEIDGQKMMQDIEADERKLERWQNSKLYRFFQKFPAVNNKYITMKVQQQ